MTRTLPLHHVSELRSAATQAALDALATMQPRRQRGAPLGSSHCLGVQAQDILLTPIVSFAPYKTSAARDDYGSPLAVAASGDMALHKLVERHRTAMNLRHSEMMWVVHYRDAIGLLALERAKAARTQLFLSRDALAPMALTHLMPDRAARRFCDRLVALGAVRELTGRDSFRLYGV